MDSRPAGAEAGTRPLPPGTPPFLHGNESRSATNPSGSHACAGRAGYNLRCLERPALRSLPDQRAATTEKRDTNSGREQRHNRGGCRPPGCMNDSQRKGSGNLRHCGRKADGEGEVVNPQSGRDRHAEKCKQSSGGTAEESFPTLFSDCPGELNRRKNSQPRTTRGQGELRGGRGLKNDRLQREGEVVPEVPAHCRLECSQHGRDRNRHERRAINPPQNIRTVSSHRPPLRHDQGKMQQDGQKRHQGRQQ